VFLHVDAGRQNIDLLEVLDVLLQQLAVADPIGIVVVGLLGERPIPVALDRPIGDLGDVL
jgi:hypothetical protein